MTQLEKFQIKCQNDKDFQNAITSYARKHGLILPDNLTYEYGIDLFFVLVNNVPVLIVGQPPVSNYKVRETEHTRKLLKSSHDKTNVKLAAAV